MTQQNANFFDLAPEDILYMTISLLCANSSSSLLNLAKTSKKCHGIATPFLYSSVRLDEQRRTRQLISRLLDENDEILNHVREITVSSFGKDKFGLHESDVLRILSNVKQLQTFNWNTPAFMSGSILSSLEKSWPDARLNVERIAKPRRSETPNRLYPSPNLHSLKCNIRWVDPVFLSEIPDLHDVVSKSPQLKILDLTIDHHSSAVPPGSRVLSDSATAVSTNSKYLLPQVKSITIPYQSSWMLVPPPIGTVERLTCAICNHAADWSRIRQLNLTGIDPTFMFRHLQGSVPNLKNLDLALQVPEESQVVHFLSTIDALQELRIVNYKSNVKSSLKSLCVAILEHLDSLETLVFRTPMGYQRALWPSEHLRQLQDSKVSHLELDLPLEQIIWETQANDEASTSSMQGDVVYPSLGALLPGFGNVKTMKLWVSIPTTACAFSANYAFDSLMGSVSPPPLLEDKAIDTATNLFRQIYAQNSNAKLEKLELCFQRYYMADRGQQMPVFWPVGVKKMDGGGRGDPRLKAVSRAQKQWN